LNAALETSKGAGLLPEGFEKLECASEWSLRTETERIKHRQESSYAAITEFRDAVLPELPRIFEYLNAKDLRTLSVRDENLLFLTLALAEGLRCAALPAGGEFLLASETLTFRPTEESHGEVQSVCDR